MFMEKEKKKTKNFITSFLIVIAFQKEMKKKHLFVSFFIFF